METQVPVELGRLSHLARYRRYRYGFVSAPLTAAATPIAGWPSIQTSDRVLWHHPEARVEIFSPYPGATAVLLGEAFSTTAESVSQIVERLVADAGDMQGLDTLGGRWALLVTTPQTTRVYNDAMGARSVYWRADGLVASHAALFEEFFGATTDARVEEFMGGRLYKRRAQTKYLPGDLTRYAGVYALVPNNYFDVASGTTHRYWPVAPVARTSLADLHAEIDSYLSALSRHVSSSGHRAVLGATGGADSRLLMAGLLHAKIPFVTFTSGWDSLKGAEREKILETVAAADLRHLVLPNLARGEFVRIALANSSGVGGSSTTVEWLAREFASPDTLFLIGHGGEILRDDKAHFSAFTPDLWARAYGRLRAGAEASADEVAFVQRAFEGFFDRGNVAQAAGFGVPPEEFYYWEHRMAMWGGGNVANAFDVGINNFPGFNSRRLYETAFGVQAPTGSRSRRLFHTATARLSPALGALSSPN